MMRWLPYALACCHFSRSCRFLHQAGYEQNRLKYGDVRLWRNHFYCWLNLGQLPKVTGQSLLVTRTGLLYAIAAGLAFSGVTILLYLTFAHISVSLGSPTIRVMGIVIASLLGVLLLHEPFTWRYALGVLMTIAGVALIVLR